MDPLDPMDMPLEPTPGYIVAELIEIKFFHPVALPDGTEGALQGAGGRGTPIMRVVAVGEGVEGWSIGDYFAVHPNNSELSWYWKDPLPLQVMKPEVIPGRLNKKAIERELALMEKFDKPVQPPGPGQPSAKADPLVIEGPPSKKIIHPGCVLPEEADLTPEL